MLRQIKFPLVFGVSLIVIACSSFQANAIPPFAKKEKKTCDYCHLSPSGGKRGFRGLYYKGHNLSFKGFVEAKEAKKAGVKVGVKGVASKPTKAYTGK